METRICTKCGPPAQPIENFPWKNSLLGKRHAVCKTCTAERSKRLYNEDKESQIERVRINNQRYRGTAREYVWDFLSSHACIDCGETDPIVLEFDHMGDKSDEVSRLVGRGASIEVIQKEIDHCVVRCSNCHRRKTALEQGWFRGKK